jgi:hypothetical protein
MRVASQGAVISEPLSVNSIQLTHLYHISIALSTGAGAQTTLNSKQRGLDGWQIWVYNAEVYDWIKPGTFEGGM